MAETIVDAMKNANVALADDKRIAYHILIDWVHCAVWSKHVAQSGDASSTRWPTIWVAMVMTIWVLARTHVVQWSACVSMVWHR